MTDGPVGWNDAADEVFRGDITVAAAYVTPAGGAVAVGVAPCGLADRDRGTVGFTTSLGFGKKLERIVRDPHVALAYHARDHGFSASPRFVLAQALAGHDAAGLRLVAAPGLLPAGGRRAGFLGHAFRPRLVGLATRVLTGWLEVTGDGAIYAPHTSKGFVAPPKKNLLLVSNGLMAKVGHWQAGRSGAL